MFLYQNISILRLHERIENLCSFRNEVHVFYESVLLMISKTMNQHCVLRIEKAQFLKKSVEINRHIAILCCICTRYNSSGPRYGPTRFKVAQYRSGGGHLYSAGDYQPQITVQQKSADLQELKTPNVFLRYSRLQTGVSTSIIQRCFTLDF